MTVFYKKKTFKIRKIQVLDDFCGYFGPRNYVSMTHCIAPKLCGAHFKGSIIPRAHFEGSKTLWANLQSIFAPRDFGALEVRPAEL